MPRVGGMGGLIHSVAYANGQKVGDVPLPAITDVLAEPNRFIWVALHEPDEPLMRQIQEEFGLHDLAVEDALQAHQRPKLDRFGGSVFVVLRTAHLVDGESEFGEIEIFVGPPYVVSVRHGSAVYGGELRTHCEATPMLLAKGPAFVLYALMDFVVDQYFPLVDRLEDELETLEEEIFAQTVERETMPKVYDLKRSLVDIKRALSPLMDVTNRLLGWDNHLI